MVGLGVVAGRINRNLWYGCRRLTIAVVVVVFVTADIFRAVAIMVAVVVCWVGVAVFERVTVGRLRITLHNPHTQDFSCSYEALEYGFFLV